jgi:hypothetical protein
MSTDENSAEMMPNRRSIERARATGSWSLFGLILCGGLVISLASVAEPESNDAPRPTMRAVFAEMKVLIPLSLSESGWSDPKNRKQILEALDRLERAADTLERHGRSREVGFDELALNLARDLRAVQDHYRAGAYDEARFFLTGSLQNCVSCHIRLPYERSFPLADQLIDQVEIQALDPREKAWLFVTVRRFEAALTVWEALMRDPDVPPAQLDAGGVLVDYLNVVIRVRSDVARANRELSAFAKRSNVPVYLERRLHEWRSALDALKAKKFGPDTTPSLDLGTSLAEEAGKISEGPYGRDGLIQDLAAASQLVRWLEIDRARRERVTKNPTDRERLNTAQAYYWLGVVEARSLDGFWVSLSERHFEAAIRSDPRGPLAVRAYARLEETQILGYGGASGLHLPADVWTNLKELRELMGVE